MLYAPVHPKIDQISHKTCADSQLHPYDVERDDEHGEKKRKESYAYRVDKYGQGLLLVLAVDVDHARREYLYEQQYGKLAY